MEYPACNLLTRPSRRVFTQLGAPFVSDLLVLLMEAFRFIEERDAERIPVVDDGRLVGVVSLAALQRRLAEDEDPPEPDEA